MEEKSAKWGFNFEQGVPNGCNESMGDAKNEVEQKLPAENSPVAMMSVEKFDGQRAATFPSQFIPPKIIQTSETPVMRARSFPSVWNLSGGKS